jgi:hypothetical protein
MPVVDEDGRRLGRLVAAYCAPDPYTVVWLVLRLPGVRRRWRAVPAELTQCNTASEISLQVPYRREQVLASPVVDEDSLDTSRCRGEVEAFYSRVQDPSTTYGSGPS